MLFREKEIEELKIRMEKLESVFSEKVFVEE